MKTYRLVWDTSKIASFGVGFGYNIFNAEQSKVIVDQKGKKVRVSNPKVFGPIIEAELGITGYEYLAGIKFGKIQSLSKSSKLITIFTGKSENWKDLKTNIDEVHYIFGVRLNRKFIVWALKYHTDFETNKMISIQFGIGE
jgi:hypothetical protein